MKHIGKLKKGIASICFSLVLSLMVGSVPVQAVELTEYETEVSLPKLTDIILTAQGVVANESTLNSVSNALVEKMQSEVERIYNGMVEAGETTWDNVTNYIGECIEDYRIEKPITAFIESVWDNGFLLPTVTAVDVATSLSPNEHGGAGRRRGETYFLDDEVTDMVSDTFSNWWSENSGYYIYRVPAFSEIPVSYFANSNVYEVAKQFVSLHADNDFVYIAFSSGSTLTAWTPSVGAQYYVYDTTYTPDNSAFAICQAVSWVQTVYKGFYVSGGSSTLGIDCDYAVENYDTLTLDSFTQITDSYWAPRYTSVTASSHSGYNHKCIVSKFARNIKIFKSMDSVKSYDTGQQMVYFSPSYTSVTVNSVSYSGDYYCDNSSTYSYSVVQETIDNSTEITDSIVDSIVDNSVTNITNNYITIIEGGSGDSSGDSSEEDDDDGFLDRVVTAIGDLVGDLLGLIEELVDILVAALVNAVGIIVSGLTEVLVKLGELETQVEGLEVFLSEFFWFLPVDYWSIITATMLCICFLAIIRFIKK